jgi:hypothetical protein
MPFWLQKTSFLTQSFRGGIFSMVNPESTKLKISISGSDILSA